MKKILIILGVLAAFTSCKTKEKSAEDVKNLTSANKVNLSFAYVNSDSLVANYLYFNEVNEQLKKTKQAYEKKFGDRASGLQRQIKDFQEKSSEMTLTQGRAVEKDLAKKQQNLQQYQQSLTQDLRNEEAKLNKKLYEKVSKFLEDYAKEKGLDFIFKHSTGGEIWYIKNSMDITNEVIEKLNAAYSAENAEEKK